MADDKKDKGAKKRIPSAQKRDIQSKKRNVRNRAFKAAVNSAVRALKDSVAKKEAESVKTNLSDVYSLMDKAVKKGIYKINKANRVKSRLNAASKI
ncbi:MAG: 30S ribosomal protein S20 [Candidatus Melainabacteria bacterium]|nr:30S ribosomal protein S20 [Candidatus Melainabacteria bacterium]